MHTRGQITLFIILGLVILATASVLFFVLPSNEAELDDVQETSVERYVSSCLEEVTEEALVQLGRGGGYLLDIETASGTGVQTVPLLMDSSVGVEARITATEYYVVRQHPSAPPLALYKDNAQDSLYRPTCIGDSCQYSVQSQLEQYIDTEMRSCVEDGQAVFSSQGTELTLTQLDGATAVSINENDVAVTYTPGITADDGTASRDVAAVAHTSPVKLKKLFVLADGGTVNGVIDATGIIEAHSRDPGFIVLRDGNDILQNVLKYDPAEITFTSQDFLSNMELVVIRDVENDYVYQFLLEDSN